MTNEEKQNEVDVIFEFKGEEFISSARPSAQGFTPQRLFYLMSAAKNVKYLGSAGKIVYGVIDHSKIKVGSQILDVEAIRCPACGGVHGSPSQGFGANEPLSEWNKKLTVLNHLYKVDGVLVVVSNTCRSKYIPLVK